MVKDMLSPVLHQFLLMLRDPVMYLAIDEANCCFAEDEILAIRIAKAKALLAIFRIDAALERALQLDQELKADSLIDLEMLNLLTIIKACAHKGDYQAQKSYTDEAYIRVKNSNNEMVKALVKAENISTFYREHKDVEAEVKGLVDAIPKADNPYYRISLLVWLGRIYSLLGKYDLALNYRSAAYDVATQHQLSICSLELCIDIVANCANLHKQEMAENFYDLAQRLIAQLRLPIFEVRLNYNYAILKGSEKDFQAAVLFYQKSLTALDAAQTDLPQIRFDVYNNLANALNRLNQGKDALQYQLKAEKLIEGKDLGEIQINLSANIALSMIALKRWDEALDRLKKAAHYYKQNNKLEQEIQVTRALGFYYQIRQDYLRGYAVLHRLDELNQRYITSIQQDQSQLSDHKLQEIINDSKTIRAKYEQLLHEISKRQATRFIGQSKAAKRVIDSAVFASMHREASVLIQGESGSGKILVAQMIHYSSPQKNQPFVIANCAAISAADFELEFFGAAAGEHSGVPEERKGFFELAGEGTLFLNEISELPLDFQAKLLNAIDKQSFTPIGKEQAQNMRCKIIASTNHDTMQMLEQGKFRLDLLHRLNTLEIAIPPLRERLEDIPLLVEIFTRNIARETSKRLPQINDAFFERLNQYSFPGNVRELKNIIERIFILYYKPVWNAEILEHVDAFRRNQNLSGSLVEHNIKDIDRERIIEALQRTGGKQKTAAKLLNMSESTLCRRIKRYKLK
jgi:DNA-binding NtrC family response regulator